MKKNATGGAKAAKTGLGAYLGPVAVVALSFGYAVGWGSFVMPGTMFLPGAGPAGTTIGILLGAAAMAVFAFNYNGMLQRLPGPGGAPAFATKAFGADHGFLVAWFLWLTYVAILWANATALVLLARFLFDDALQFGFHYKMAGFDVYFGETALCVAVIALCGAVCLFRKRLVSRLNTILAGVFIVAVVAVFTAALSCHEGGFASMAPAFSPVGGRAMQIIHILAMIPWAFVGFEAIVHSSAEFRFPVRRTLSLMLCAIAISATVYLLLAILPVLSFPDGCANWSDYIERLGEFEGIDAMPVFAASKKALGTAGLGVIGGAMLAAQLTGIFGTLVASSRLMHSMANDGIIPGWFGRLNRDGTPANAVVFVVCVSFAIPFFGRTVTGWPVDVSSLGAAIAFGYTSAAAFATARRESGRGAVLQKAAGLAGVAMAAGFCILMLVPNYISGETLSAESYLVLAVWCLAGFMQYRHVFMVDWLSRFGHTIIVWIGVLVIIFFSSLMWLRMAICNASEKVFGSLVGQTIDEDIVGAIMDNVSADMLAKTLVELILLVSSLAIIINLFTILRRREKQLLQQKIEAEESAGKSRSYFFSTVSHDIRTPLNAIIGYSEMMKTGFKTDAERMQAVDSILVSGKNLLRLVNHVLDFSKLESGNLEITPAPTEISKLVADVVDSFRSENGNSAIEFRCRAGGLPALSVDPQRLGQILFNLVGNAVKFTKSGFVEVRASYTREDEGTGALRIEVEDTGCGIAEEDVKLIMSPYEQVHAKQARNGGTGIGLAVCRRLAKAMGGVLAVSSTPGKGSVFTVTLPGLKECSIEKAPEASGAEPAAPLAPPRRRRILIVDDQKMNLMVLKAMLKKLGDFEVATAMNGREALDVITKNDAAPFNMVLTDMWMPEMDGRGLVKALRASGRFHDLPVHVVTADVEMGKKFGEDGFDGLLLKPLTVDKLRPVVCGGDPG